MQRREPEGIVISCDFCGTDWDQVIPMIEGHQGSVICLDCFKQAFEAVSAQQPPTGEPFTCTLCLRELKGDIPRWSPTDRPAAANPSAQVCDDCIKQASKAFHRDPDVPWRRPGRG